jgi:hypothetical protein
MAFSGVMVSTAQVDVYSDDGGSVFHNKISGYSLSDKSFYPSWSGYYYFYFT